MCGRGVQSSSPFEIAERFGALNSIPNADPSWNLAPTQDILAVRFNPETRQRHLDKLHWGLIPIWAKDPSIGNKLINARAETLSAKPAFRDAFKSRRCIVPMDLFYEWKKVGQRAGRAVKQPFAIGLKSREPMGIAGLWERWRAPDGQIVRSCTIVTTDANELVRDLHDRMPVVLDEQDYALWLGEEERGDPADLLRPYPADKMVAWPVDPRVNNVKNNDARLVEELAGALV